MAEHAKQTKQDEPEEVVHFSFGDAPEVEESSYKVLPAGEAIFTIKKITRARRPFGKYGESNIAEIVCAVTMLEGGEKAEVQDNIPLVTAMGWKILQLVTAVGLRKHGEGNKINPAWWTQLIGKDGRCTIGHRKDPKGQTWNQIAKFLGPEEKYVPKDAPKDLEI